MLMTTLTGIFGMTASAANPGEVKLQVQQVFTYSGNPASSTFTYELKPKATTNPMPVGGGRFTINGSAALDVGITFTSGGTYYYELKHVTSPTTGYSYGKATYTIEVFVAGGSLNTAVSVTQDQSGNKMSKIEYKHSYTAPAAPPAAPPAKPPVAPQVPPAQAPAPVPQLPPAPPVTTVQTPTQTTTRPSPATTTPTPTPEPSPDPTPELAPPPPPAPIPALPQEDVEEHEDTPTIVLADEPIPLHGGLPFEWALLNLIMSLIGIALGIITGIRVIRIIKNEQHEDEDEEFFEDEKYERRENKKRRLMWLAVTFLMSFAGIILFIITENMRHPMVMVDRWTIINAIILAIEILSAVFCIKENNQTSDNEEYPRYPQLDY